MMVNALHEVFSDSYSQDLKEVDVPAAKQNVLQALSGAVEKLAVGGYLLLFDGLEMMGDIHRKVRVKFRNPQAREHFMTFVREYHPFQIILSQFGGLKPDRTFPARFYALYHEIDLFGERAVADGTPGKLPVFQPGRIYNGN